MRIRVLGSAAGGGFPQWNCGCPNCRGVRAGTIRATPRRQESIAISSDGRGWFLLNTSPEIREQIESFPGLHPQAPRHSPIQAIVLTNGDLDHTLGVLSLRESHPITLYATEGVRRGFTEGNVLYRTLERFPEQVTWRRLPPGQTQPLGGVGSDLSVTAIPAPGKRPLHLEGPGRRPPSPEDNVGFVIREQSRPRLAYFSGIAGPSPEVEQALADVEVVFFDGTFWSSDELVAAGLGTRTAEEMAHWPIGGQGGSLEFLSRPGRTAIYIHINNTNPILHEDSKERRAVTDAGIEIAHDGLDLDI